MDNLKDDMICVKSLGERIGYGNLIECAKALWNELLQHKRFDDVMPNYEQCAKELNNNDFEKLNIYNEEHETLEKIKNVVDEWSKGEYPYSNNHMCKIKNIINLN